MRGEIPTPALLVLFFLSGAAALVYEVLWLKELGRLFGVTVYAASTALAVFSSDSPPAVPSGDGDRSGWQAR